MFPASCLSCISPAHYVILSCVSLFHESVGLFEISVWHWNTTRAIQKHRESYALQNALAVLWCHMMIGLYSADASRNKPTESLKHSLIWFRNTDSFKFFCPFSQKRTTAVDLCGIILVGRAKNRQITRSIAYVWVNQHYILVYWTVV